MAHAGLRVTESLLSALRQQSGRRPAATGFTRAPPPAGVLARSALTPHWLPTDLSSMTRDEIIARIKAHESAIRAEGVVHLAIFGSRARGDARPDSDLDVLVEVDPARPKFSLVDLAGVCLKIEEILGLDANVQTRRSLSERFKDRIADEIIEIF